MKSRRLIASPEAQNKAPYRFKLAQEGRAREAANVRFVPIADITPFIGLPRMRELHWGGDRQAKRLGGLEVDDEFELSPQ
jgi:hypothetical protein